MHTQPTPAPAVILFDSVFKMGKNYYPQMFYKYIVKLKKITWYNNDDLEISSDYSEEASDKSDKETSEEE